MFNLQTTRISLEIAHCMTTLEIVLGLTDLDLRPGISIKPNYYHNESLCCLYNYTDACYSWRSYWISNPKVVGSITGVYMHVLLITNVHPVVIKTNCL